MTGEPVDIRMELNEKALYDYCDYAPDGSSAVLSDSANGKLLYFVKGSDAPKKETDAKYGAVEGVRYTDDGKYIFIYYKGGNARIMRASDFSDVKVLYGQYDVAGRVFSVGANGGYLVDGYPAILLNSDLDEIASIDNALGVNRKSGELTIRSDFFGICSTPVISYDELIEYARMETENFEPDERFLKRYGVASY